MTAIGRPHQFSTTSLPSNITRARATTPATVRAAATLVPRCRALDSSCTEVLPEWATVRSTVAVPAPEQSAETTDQSPDGAAPAWFSKPSQTAPAAHPVTGGALDGGALDGGVLDGGALDGGVLDGGALDGGALDGGALGVAGELGDGEG